jgi:hypothetical protein
VVTVFSSIGLQAKLALGDSSNSRFHFLSAGPDISEISFVRFDRRLAGENVMILIAVLT